MEGERGHNLRSRRLHPLLCFPPSHLAHAPSQLPAASLVLPHAHLPAEVTVARRAPARMRRAGTAKEIEPSMAAI